MEDCSEGVIEELWVVAKGYSIALRLVKRIRTSAKRRVIRIPRRDGGFDCMAPTVKQVNSLNPPTPTQNSIIIEEKQVCITG